MLHGKAPHDDSLIVHESERMPTIARMKRNAGGRLRDAGRAGDIVVLPVGHPAPRIGPATSGWKLDEAT